MRLLMVDHVLAMLGFLVAADAFEFNRLAGFAHDDVGGQRARAGHVTQLRIGFPRN